MCASLLGIYFCYLNVSNYVWECHFEETLKSVALVGKGLGEIKLSWRL
jgi:hypothetical protein